jgi:hypothetical protein
LTRCIPLGLKGKYDLKLYRLSANVEGFDFLDKKGVYKINPNCWYKVVVPYVVLRLGGIITVNLKRRDDFPTDELPMMSILNK